MKSFTGKAETKARPTEVDTKKSAAAAAVKAVPSTGSLKTLRKEEHAGAEGKTVETKTTPVEVQTKPVEVKAAPMSLMERQKWLIQNGSG